MSSIQRVILDLLVIAVIATLCWAGYAILKNHDKVVYNNGYNHGIADGLRLSEQAREMVTFGNGNIEWSIEAGGTKVRRVDDEE